MDSPTGIALDPSSATPLYQQLFDQIAARVASRAFPPGYRLPPTRVLASQLSTHRNTVVRAYVDLERAGFVSSTVGRGTFVAQGQPPAASAAGAGARRSRSRSRRLPAPSGHSFQGRASALPLPGAAFRYGATPWIWVVGEYS